MYVLQLQSHTQLSGVAITPLGKTPPRGGLLSTTSLPADESANLSPAKSAAMRPLSSFQSHSSDTMLMNQLSTGFNVAPMSRMDSSDKVAPVSQMDSSDSDSGSESDSESSDSEDERSSGEEDGNTRGRLDNIEELKRNSIPSSDDMNTAPFGSSSGFWDEGYDLLGATSQFGEHHHQSKTLQQQEGEDFHDEAMDTGTTTMTTTTSHSSGGKQSRLGRKRKNNSTKTSQLSLRKAQKFMNSIQFSSDAEDGDASSHNPSEAPPASTSPAPSETASKKKSVSCLSLSDMNSGSELDEDEEEGEIPSEDEEQDKKPLSRQKSAETFSSEPRHHTTDSSRSNQRGVASLGSRVEGVKHNEGEGETNSLVVSFQLSSIPKLPMQKPKATVEPFFHNTTSTSKLARRRSTMDASGERDGDEVPSRSMSRERGERSTYSRHRDEYGR